MNIEYQNNYVVYFFTDLYVRQIMWGSIKVENGFLNPVSWHIYGFWVKRSLNQCVTFFIFIEKFIYFGYLICKYIWRIWVDTISISFIVFNALYCIYDIVYFKRMEWFAWSPLLYRQMYLKMAIVLRSLALNSTIWLIETIFIIFQRATPFFQTDGHKG